MAKTPAPAHSPSAAFSERELLEAGRQLSAALAQYRETVLEIYSQPGPIIELDETMDRMLGMGDVVDAELSDLKRAIELIETDAPIAELSSRGHRWRGPLNPKWMLYFASLAGPDDVSYREKLPVILARYQARQDELQTECGRPTKSGAPCKAIPVLWPGGGRDSACTRHLTTEEKSALDEGWERTQREQDCPGCGASAGAPCNEDPEAAQIVDGEWARIRAFNGRKMHEPRLWLGTPAPTEVSPPVDG